MKAIKIITLFVLLILTSCTLITNQNKLNDSDLRHIRNLGLLGENEKILIFSSNFTKKTSGNFVTNKRIGAYWMDKGEKEKFKDFAYFGDIAKIDSVDLTKAWTYASYLIITRKDSSVFKVYIDGNKDKYLSFIRCAVRNWGNYK